MSGNQIQPIEEIRNEKIKKLQAIEESGFNPYPPTLKFISNAIALVREQEIGSKTAVRGRLTSIRTHGGISFADIQDSSGKIQLAFKKEQLTEAQTKLFQLIDPSDFIEVIGELFITRAGEITIQVEDFNILSKSIRPVPDKADAIKDKEIRLRKRYLDLLTNPAAQRVFEIRHKLTRGIRHFLENNNLVEVETPVLQPLYGGANAKPFTTHINALDAKAYLRIAPELYLKRLVVAGYEGVFELAKDFRNEGVDQTHYPEFTMLEVYVSYIDYHGMMDLMEEMLRFVSSEVLAMPKVTVQDEVIDLSGEWRRVAITDLVSEYLKLDATTLPLTQLQQIAKDHHIEFSPKSKSGELIFLLFDKLIAHTLINPTWVIDYPIEVSPLSKSHRNKPGYTERFELYIGGVELMDGWSELTNPLEQRDRFEAENYRDFEEAETPQPLDEDFIEAMEYGMPPFAGVGTGIDRLTMFFSNTWAIQETILFPFKKPLNLSDDTPPTVEPELPYSTDTKYTIEENLKANLPDLSFAYTIITGVKVDSQNEQLAKLTEDMTEKNSHLTTAEIKTKPSIQGYRQVIKHSGSDPDSHRPSPEALLRRIAQGKGLYQVNTAVDAYNIAVIETGIGLGGFDYDRIKGPVSLRYAKPNETMHLLGKDEITTLKPNQVIYADAEKPLTMDLNYRDIDATKVTTETKNIILFADGAPGIDQTRLLTGLQRGADLIMQFCGGSQSDLYLVR